MKEIKMCNKNILLFSNSFWSKQRFRRRFIRELKDLDYEVSVLAFNDKYVSTVQNLGCEAKVIPACSDKSRVWAGIIGVIFSLYYLLKQRYDLIVLFTMFPTVIGGGICRVFGKKYAVINTGLGHVFLHDNRINFLIRKFYKFALQKACHVTFANPQDMKCLIDLNIVSCQKASVVGTGCDIDYYLSAPSSLRRADSVPFRFLMVSRLIGEKGVREYSEAARNLACKYSGVEFQLLGQMYPTNPSSITAEEIHQWSHIDWLGHVDDVRPIMLNSNCVVLPSYREALGMVLVEAGLLNIPVIASNVPGCNLVIDHGLNGLLCKKKSADSLFEEMEKMLLLSPERRSKMSENLKLKCISNFSDIDVAKRYIKHLKIGVQS